MKQLLYPLLLTALVLTGCASTPPNAMSAAAARGDVAAMEQARLAGVSVNPEPQSNSFPLDYAVKNKHPEAVAFLLQHGANVAGVHLRQAISVDDAQIVKLLLNQLGPEHALMPIAMDLALVFGARQSFQLLLDLGVEVSLPQESLLGREVQMASSGGFPRYDALTRALAGGSANIVEQLLLMPVDWRLDRDREILTEGGAVQMNLLCIWSLGDADNLYQPQKQNPDILSPQLLSHFSLGNAVNGACTSKGSTPLMLASHRQYYGRAMIQQLIALGANPAATNNNGSNAMHYAAETNNTDTLEYLISLGVNPGLVNRLGYSPYGAAHVYGHDEAKRVLYPYSRSDGNSGDLMGKLIATAGLVAVGSQANLSAEQMTQFAAAATQDIWVNDGQSNQLAQLGLQQQAVANNGRNNGASPQAGERNNPAHGPKKPLRNEGVCRQYTINNYQAANLVGEPQIDTLCATGVVHYRVYLANYGRNDADAGELEKVYQAHLLSMQNANRVDKATQLP